jgi:hypothetical protein
VEEGRKLVERSKRQAAVKASRSRGTRNDAAASATNAMYKALAAETPVERPGSGGGGGGSGAWANV